MIERDLHADPTPGWVTAVPSRRNPELVPAFALRLASRLGLPYRSAIVKVRDTPPQKEMQNSVQQARNAIGAFAIVPDQVEPGPVLLVDDMGGLALVDHGLWRCPLRGGIGARVSDRARRDDDGWRLVTTIPISADGQAIALACSSLALQGDRSLKPLTPVEWHELSLAMSSSEIRPRDLVGLATDELRDSLGLGAALADRLSSLLSRGGQLAFEVERLSGWGIWIVTRADDAYPAVLKQRLRGQTPPVLFGAGPQTNLQLPAIAIVGSRDVDDEGLQFAASLGRRCAKQGFAVVSGAARGVDLSAMTGALSYEAPAIGVTVDPLERLVRRRELRVAITDELLTLVTPFTPSARWHAGNAMRRNRLIYTLAQAAVVVASSTDKGGTRSGALENLKAGWIPLHVRDDGSPGNRRLIADGGLPLPTDEPVEQLDVRRLTLDPRPSLVARDDAPTALAHPSQSTHGHAPPADPLPQIDDAFVVVWPILAQHLHEPRGEREVADRMQLELTQARAWLKRAVDQGHVEIKPRPKRYVLRGTAEQLRIEADWCDAT
jgi:predicted Rossmann fold nucleotide-binding protein DprA/Smf involved in DNA uptake